MGVYCYTRRKELRTVDGITMVRFAFAYKDHFWEKQTPVQARKHAAAARAYDETDKIKYGVVGDWADATKEGMRVFRITDEESYFMDTRSHEDIGFVHRKGRKWYIEWTT
jgi:hypothetical protein